MVTENGQSDGNTSFLRAARNGQLDKVLEHLKSNIDINTSNANGLNALHLASKDGHIQIVEELLKRGAVVDAATKKGNTALHIASLAGQEEVVKLLVQHGASVNVQSQNGFTPLYMAAQENHDNVVKYLLANGANQSLSTEDGFTPLAVAMQQGHDKVVTVLLENDTRGKVRLPALHIAAKKDDVKAAKLLLENEHNPDVTSKSGFTPLHIASHYGNQQIANLLIQKGADVNYAAKHNITPLHVAAKWGKTNMVGLLLEHGATIESKTRDGLTPLHCAARSGHENVVDILLEKGAPISSKTKNGLAPLHMAAQGDHLDAARILLYHRAPVDEVTVDYLTALHVAAHCGHVRVAKLLLDRQADANARALNGFTPLHIACKKNRIKVVELLLKHGASIGATTESGLTPLHVASFMGCMNIVIYLLQHDANPDVPTVRGETPLHLAARANQTDIIRILLRNGAQVDARAREQQTPLHIASRLGNVDIVMLLLQHGAKVDSATKDMYTALHIAAKEGQDEVATVLIENGASVNATTKKGFTPLHLAAKYGNLKVAKLLLQKEASVDSQGKNGVTPLHVASHYDHQNVALLLLDKGASPHAIAKNGHTPLHIAARKNQMDIANTLLEYGAQPNAESKAGFTSLHLSAQEGHTDMSALLIEHKADTNHQAKNGLTPLHLCAIEDRVPVAEILVKNGADINSTTKGGYTPLHIASHYGQANMVRFLLANGANVGSSTSLCYTPLHQAAQQGHTNIVNILLENKADANAITTNGQTPLNIAQKLGYITVIETLKVVTSPTKSAAAVSTNADEKYRVVAPEAMHETFLSDSEEEGGEDILDGFGTAPHERHVYLPYFNGTTLLTREDTVLGDHTYRYLTADEMKSLGDDSLPIDVTRDERIDSNRIASESNMLPPQHIEDTVSPEHVSQNYVEYIKKYAPDNVDISKHPVNIGKLHWKNFLVSFLVDARGGAMRGCRHSGVRVIVPPRCAPSPTRITCRYVRPQRTPHPPPLMEGEALASRVLELGPVGAKFLGPVIIEVPHFAALRSKEREIVILRSDNGESWKEHTVEASEDVINDVLHDSFEADDLNQMEDIGSGRITRILTQDFPQYFAVVSRIRQEVHAIGPEGGMVSSTVVPQVQAVFPEGALTKKIKVGLQAQPIDPELTAKLLGHGVAVSPVVTVEPRRRKFHKAITLSMPAPRPHSQGMINQYSGSAPTLRLLCSITGGTTRAQWEDVTGSTPLTFVNDCVSFTTTVSARFWLMDCRNIGDATKMATELYKEAIHVPFMAKFVVFAKRIDPLEARLRVFCMTDDKEDKTLEQQEHFTEVAKSRDVEVLEGKPQFIEFAGNLVPITKSGEQLQFSFRAFRENRLPFSVRVKDQHAEAVGRCLFMREPKVAKGEPPQQPICILNIVLPDDIVSETVSLTDGTDLARKYTYLSESFDYYRPDPRLADMSNLLGEDWVPLANQLGLTTSEINVIKSEYPDSVAKQAQSMLRMWLSQSGNKAQTNTLENALKRIGREDIIPQCLNIDHTVTRKIQPELGKYKPKKHPDEVLEETSKKIEAFDKYSAEEKAVETSDEEDFNKTVTERREQIEKRLSATIPASTQRVEIVQEITTIKQQSLVEDKIAEVEKVALTQPPIKALAPGETLRTVTQVIDSKTTDIPSDSEQTITNGTVTPMQKTVDKKAHISSETHKTVPGSDGAPHGPTEDQEFLQGVVQRIDDDTKMPLRRLIADEDPKSPKLSKTPPPSPADFFFRDQAATNQDLEAQKKKTKMPSHEEEDAENLELQEDQQTTGSQIVTYESVLLTPDHNKPFNRSNSPINNTTSYAHIDIMLERMLNEVEQQEKIFGLDLDVLEPEESCINTLELVPSSDALIEIPVKDCIRKPKVYECVHEILINDNSNMISNDIKENVDLINFDDGAKENELEKISFATANLITTLECDEARMLLNEDIESNVGDPRKCDMYFVRKASSESLSDNYPDSWSDTNENCVDPDYEPIEHSTPLKYAYQLYDNRTGNDIWWEGTYRNLSIVPEEDEESASLLGTYSGSYLNKPYLNIPNTTNDSLVLSDNLKSSSSSLSSSSASSSDEGHYETFEKVVKAEVKLMVKTTDKGKEAIEIRSVREFMEDPKKEVPMADESKIKRKTNLLPKISKKINNLSSKFSNILDSNRKKSSTYAVLENTCNVKHEPVVKHKNHKPSFTLPRLFVRTNEAEPIKPSKSDSNLLENKELSKSRSELVATPSETFPLQFHPDNWDYLKTDLDENKIDLYANRPFYPCYNQYTVKPNLFQTNPFTEFTSNPFSCNSPIPQAYCDWLSEQEDISRGKSTTTYLAKTDAAPIEKPIGAIPAGLSSIPSDNKTTIEKTNALIESESQQSGQYKSSEETRKIDEKVETKKQKKGFLGTLKTFVGKSVDHSDSDSEKSSKKDEKVKKDKKKKKKDAKSVPKPPESVGKPKLPTPTREEADMPPPYQPPDIPLIDTEQINGDKVQIQVTDLDADTDNVSDNIKEEANKIVEKVIEDSENVASTILQKAPKPEKATKITVVNEITKSIAPVVIQEEEFSIIIDPTKKESPKKSRDTFTINIDESIEKIEKEIMKKSPILPEEKIIKPVIDPNSPIKSAQDNIYEDVDQPLVSERPPKILYEPESIQNIENLKRISIDETKTEVIEGDIADNSVVKEKPEKKRKQSRLFGLFGKSGKETDESDDDSSKKDIIEKQDKEIKEKSIEKPSSSEEKKGFLGIFKKTKKDQPDESESIITDATLSREVVKVLNDTNDFITKEIENYDNATFIESPTKLPCEKIEQTTTAKAKVPESEVADTKKSGMLGLFKKSKKEISDTPTDLKNASKDEQPIVTEEVKKVDEISASMPITSVHESVPVEYGLEHRKITEDFIHKEVKNYYDANIDKTEQVSHETPKPEGILSKFAKKKSAERESSVERKETVENKEVITLETDVKENIDKPQVKTSVLEQEKETIVEKSTEKSGFFGIFTKKPKKDKEKDDSIEKNIIKECGAIKDETTSATNKEALQEVSDDKIPKGKESTIKSETKPLQQSIVEDVTRLEKDIDDKIGKLKKETEEFISTETKIINKELESEKFLQEETKKPDDSSKAVELEKDTKDKKSGILGLFSKRKSQERETSQEKSTSVDEPEADGKHYKKDERRKSGSPFRIFKRKTEEDVKKGELVEEPIIQVVVSEQTETTAEKDGKSGIDIEIKEKLPDVKEEKRVDTKDESKTNIKDEKHDKKKSSNIFAIFSKSESAEDTEKTVKISDEVKKQMEDTHNFLSNEVEKYEDGKRDDKQTGVKEADESDEIKSSGLFGIFSKKESKDSPKVVKKKYKKHKKEKSVEEHEKVGFIEKISRKLTSSTGSETKDEIDEAADKLKEEIFNENAKFEAEISENIKQTADNLEKTERTTISKPTKEVTSIISKNIDDISTKIETSETSNFVTEVMQSFEQHLEDIKEKADEGKKSASEIITDKTEQTKKIMDDFKETDTLRQKVDEKFSSTMKLTEEIAKKLEDKAQSLKNSAASSIDESTDQVTTSLKQSLAEVEKVINDTHSTLTNIKEESKKTIVSTTEKLSEIPQVSVQVPDIEVHDETRTLVKDIAKREIDQIILTANEKVQENLKKTEDEISVSGELQNNIDKVVDAVKTKEDEIEKTAEKIIETTVKFNGESETIKTDIPADVVKEEKQAEPEKPKKEKGFLSKIGRKISKGDDSKNQTKESKIDDTSETKEDVRSEEHVKKDESSKKEKKGGSGFFGKISEKFSKSKDKSEEKLEKDTKKDKEEKKKKGEKSDDDKTIKAPVKIEVTLQEVKQKTIDFIDDLKSNYDKDQPLKTKEFGEIKRTLSDYDGKNLQEDDNIRKISEVNLDLSNLPPNFAELDNLEEKVVYVTSPTMSRRSASQKEIKDDRPTITQIESHVQNVEPSNETYSVSHPPETRILDNARKPLFHIESEEDDSHDLSARILEKRESVQSNILENVTEQVLDELINDFKKKLDDSTLPIVENIQKKEKKTDETLEHYKKESQEDVVIIEKKLRDLDKALESLEKVDIDLSKSHDEEKIEKKLKRVERKFERMASEVMDNEMVAAKDDKLTTPEVEEKREHEFQRLVSQLSTEEVSDFQKEYSHLWDEQTFSKSDEWDSKTPDSQADVQELPQETNRGPLSTSPPVSLTTTKATPLPKPRTVKTPETLPLTQTTEEIKTDKVISPVRDDLLDRDEQVDVLESYSNRKKFWENVSKDSNTTKRMSLQEIQVDKNILAKKRQSVQESTLPPVPKPRQILQTSQSVSENSTDLIETKSEFVSVKERTVSFESTTSDSSGLVQTDLTRISESDDASGDKYLSEYQASFLPPCEQKQKTKTLVSSEKTDSIDSDVAQKGSSQIIENTGYISDSEDVEHYISDSEIEDRVPQIRERQMSVFASPIAPARRSIYERSASLPTEDLYQISDRAIKLRKQYYEEQIKKEMIEEQLTSEVEDEPSPERKTLLGISLMKSEEEVEDIQDVEETDHKTDSVKDIKQSFEEKITDESFNKLQEEKRSVKDLTKDFEKQLSNAIAGQKVPITEKLDRKQESTNDIRDFMEIVSDSSTNERDLEVENFTVDSQQSISSDRLIDDQLSKPDSMEVHVDKSETEYSEKIAELDQDATDFETKSLDSLNVIDETQKTGATFDDHIPEITITLSGKQRRISEESDEDIKSEQRNTAESPIKQPEEHIQDTIWEVSVQSQPETQFDERVQEITTKVTDTVSKELPTVVSKMHLERDDDLSSSLREESDLGSEIHQDHSDSLASDKIKSDSYTDIEKIILDSLHQQQVDPDEAKKIASALVGEIESEIQKRESTETTKVVETISESTKSQMSEYLRHLAETKGLDEREVELVESVLARRQRELSKLSREDTHASSMEITDEDLRYSGAELDYSNVLEQQMDQLKAEKFDNKMDYDKIEQEQTNIFESKTGQVDKINEQHVKETAKSEGYDSYDGESVASYKKDAESKTVESVRGEKFSTETRNTIFEEDETVSESATDREDNVISQIDFKSSERTKEQASHMDLSQKRTEVVEAVTDIKSKESEKLITKTSESALNEFKLKTTTEEEALKISGEFETVSRATEELDDEHKVTCVEEKSKFDQLYKEQHDSTQKENRDFRKSDDGSEVETFISTDKKHSVLSSSVTKVDHVQEKVTSVTKTVKEIESGKHAIDDENVEKILSKPNEEIKIKTHEIIKRTSSNDSKSSLDSGKSPEDQFSTCSSGKKDSDKQKIIESENVILRKVKTDGDTSSSSSNLKPDRKSGVDFEAYSSSGESYYHSFELDSNKSRPCSSDVEGMLAAGSSEYESALTSQEISGRSHITSSEYQTAVSSLSSKESMKSLDSESSGNLASIEVSEVSETLVPSGSDLEGDMLDTVDQQLFDDIAPHSDWTSQSLPIRQSTEMSDSELLSYQGETNESVDVSEEDNADGKKSDMPTKMKRSHEMTFQPEPKVLTAESPQTDGQDLEEKLGTSLEDGGSVLSMSMSSTSSIGAVRTVIEVSRADSDRHDGSMTISGTSEQLSTETDFDSLPRKDSREGLDQTPTPPVMVTTDIQTSTTHTPTNAPMESVTITTSSVEENGIQSVSTQVTSEAQSPIAEAYSQAKTEVGEVKRKGHRRQESTSSFKPSMIILPSSNRPSEMDAKYESDLTESDKYTSSKLSFKEVTSDEKKDIDEKEESYETEADQGMHKDLREGRYLEAESDNELDLSRPQSHLSATDSDRERCTSTDDRPDSELVELALRSSVTDETDPFERPITPEPLDETKVDTPELSSEAQASVGELEQEYSTSKTREIFSSEIKLQREIPTEVLIHKELLEKRDSHGKSSSTSSEKSSFEEAEAEAAFNMVAHISPAHKVKQICPILEDEDAEKHELETRERAQKELEERRSQMRDQSPGFIPDIKVTQHMAPLVDRNFHYPELELEAKEREIEAQAQTPQTPASNSSKSSEETDQGREYVLEEVIRSIPEEPEIIDDKTATESKSEVGTVVEKTLREDSDKETDSPNSDSFEMLEKPDIMDDFVVIEEVAKEAHEFDAEGKSVKIHSKPKRVAKKHDEEVEEYLVKSAPTPLTKMTDIKYYPDGSSSDELGFEFEDSPPQDKQKTTTSKKDYGHEYDKELEANKKWIEQQFQGDQAAMIAAGYGYEMEFERGPLEDIKEEDVTDLDTASSRIGSMGSQKESGGSLGSVKDSYSSTPEYDVLAGRKYFTRSGEHDDISMSSLQEFENLEQAMSLEMKRLHQGSQDSSSNGSFKSRYLASKSGQGDDISVSSLKEFEGLEKACIAAHKMEIKVKEEEAILAQIDEGQESLASESESCETMSSKKQHLESDEEDYEKRMFEIDEIIRQAQTNVERFIDLKEAEKTESLGRGDSIEEVSKVPDLDLDAPVVKSSIKVQWKENDDVMITSTDSLEVKLEKKSHDDSTDNLDQKTTAADIMTTSTDSIELQAQKSAKDTNIMTDSIEFRDEKSNIVSSDSLELGQATSSGNNVLLSDSIDEDGSRIGAYDHSISSSTGKDFSSSVREEHAEHGAAECMAESFVSLDPTSSTATHATCHYETDSVFSGSFTSGGSNTMVSSTDTIDPTYTRETVDVAAAVRKVWFDEDLSGQHKFTAEYSEDNFKPYVTEVIEPLEDDDEYSHTIHRKVELPPEIHKVTFTGSGASDRLEQFIRDFNEGENVQESEEVDADGNIHVTKVVQKRFIVKDGSDRPMTNEEIEEYFKQMQQNSGVSTTSEPFVASRGVITKTITDGQGVKTTFTQQFDVPPQLTKSVTGVDESYLTKSPLPSSSKAPTIRKRSLRYDISVDEQAEVDPREHDWRFKLPRHGETDETDETQNISTSQRSEIEHEKTVTKGPQDSEKRSKQ